MVLPFAGKRDGGSHYTMESKPLERSNQKYFIWAQFFASFFTYKLSIQSAAF